MQSSLFDDEDENPFVFADYDFEDPADKTARTSNLSAADILLKKLQLHSVKHPHYSHDDWRRYCRTMFPVRYNSKICKIQHYNNNLSHFYFLTKDTTLLSRQNLLQQTSFRQPTPDLISNSITLASFIKDANNSTRLLVATDLQRSQLSLRLRTNESVYLSSDKFEEYFGSLCEVSSFTVSSYQHYDFQKESLNFEARINPLMLSLYRRLDYMTGDAISTLMEGQRLTATHYEDGINSALVMSSNLSEKLKDISQRLGSLTEASVRQRIGLRFGFNWAESFQVRCLNDLIQLVVKEWRLTRTTRIPRGRASSNI